LFFSFYIRFREQPCLMVWIFAHWRKLPSLFKHFAPPQILLSQKQKKYARL